MNKAQLRRILFPSLATLIFLIACDSGEEYNENGELIEKTDVRIVGVDLGRAADPAAGITDSVNKFLPVDTVYAWVRTKGSSPKTIVGVRWLNQMGQEVGQDYRLIRPTRDTALLLHMEHMAPMDTGRYSLELRLNNKVVRTEHFVVTADAAPRSVSLTRVTRAHQQLQGTTGTFVSRAVERLSRALQSVRTLAGRKDESPFQWMGLRAGMSFAEMDQVSNPGTPWKCAPALLSAVTITRAAAFENRNFSSGGIGATVDTVGQRVLEMEFLVPWTKHDRQKLELERQITETAAEWDRIPGVIRNQPLPKPGPYFASWSTPDTLWGAMILYFGDSAAVGHPYGVEIQQLQWLDRVEAQISDSLKKVMMDPASHYFWHADPCAAVLHRAR